MTLGYGWIGVMLPTVTGCGLLDPVVGTASTPATAADSSLMAVAP